ncbi:peptidoglycan-binding protein [Paracoccus aestuarii]|uniref:Peptidoglycan-binding protein n=1 Tax=Paracoccus aestuarii TaxID=453842 RepID=A0A418ZXH9_9RHOB|nr:L,D-transpeptidase family protein [Paracoccus aestuarii]RJL05192.1 peptidoglycan-binding protein [Paracoccus aestuarii]WCQ98128.1 L,D-transpeptidase family protein [Paracoccus aestuarii]
MKRITAVLGMALMLSGGVAHAAPAAGGAVNPAPRLEFSDRQMALALAVAGDSDLAAFYGENGLQPVFTGPDAALRRAALLAAIAEAPRDGIPSARYAPDRLAALGDSPQAELAHARELARLLRDLTGGVLEPGRIDPEIKRQPDRSAVPALMTAFAHQDDPAAVLRAAAPDHPAYRRLQQALAGPAHLTIPAHLPPVPSGVWRAGMRDPAVAALRARLEGAGFAAPSTQPDLHDDDLAQATMAFQRAAGLPPDGVAGPRTLGLLNGDAAQGGDARQRAIILALERLRWMGDADLSARHVWVNIPEFATAIVEDGHEVFRTRSVVGKDTPEMRTPEFSEMMPNIVVNPSWNVPRSITIRDYLPRLQANRHALSHLDVLDRSGRVLARDGIDFSGYTAANFPFRLRQKPSDDNALGIVKFIFPNPWNIYLHDTPSKSLFGNRVRAASNGCIRIGDPVDLAHALLSRQTDNPAAIFQRARDSGRETWLRLTPSVPVHLVYFTAWPGPDGSIRLHDDIYGRDARLWQALQAEGRGPAAGSDVMADAPASP